MKRILSILALSALSFAGYSQCSVYVFPSTNTANAGSSINFWGGGSTSNQGVFQWSIPGGSPSSGFTYDTTSFISSTFAAAGTYTVCVTWYDSILSCIDSACTSVIINSVGGCNLPVSISASNLAPCANETVALVAAANGSGVNYLWSTGQTGSTINPTSSGQYIVTATDANGCTGSDTVEINFENAIVASMSATNETCVSCCDGEISLSASGGNGSFTYSWSNSSTTASLTGLCPGTYTVTITDATSGCTQVASATIAAFTCSTISGYIAQDAPAVVYLIEENNGVLSAVDSMVLDSVGIYYFQACPGTYYVKAALLPTHPMYASYIPTYYDSAALWSQASAVVMGSSNIYNLDFSLLSGTNTGGPGFVGGSVTSGGNRGIGDPVVNAQVFITDMNDNLVAFAKTDAEGNYDMTGLAYGDYKMHVDILNKTSYPRIFTLNAENEGLDGANFLVFGDYVRPESPTGVGSVAIQNAKMFPNPAKNQLSIQSEEQIQSVVIYSVLGEQMIRKGATTNTLNIDLSGLSAGQYIVEIQNESSVQHQVLIKE